MSATFYILRRKRAAARKTAELKAAQEREKQIAEDKETAELEEQKAKKPPARKTGAKQ